MQVLLDSQPCSFGEASSRSVGEVLEDILARVRAQNRVVICIRCDGLEVEPGELEHVLSKPADAYERIEFVSGTAGELVIDALGRIQAMLADLEPTKAQAVEFLNQGQTPRAMELLKPYFETWRHAHEAVQQSAALLGLDLTVMALEGMPFMDIFSRFAQQLRQLKDAFEAKDMVTLTDILTYEADAITRQWIDIVELVKQAAGTR
jgi:hypothetical protein